MLKIATHMIEFDTEFKPTAPGNGIHFHSWYWNADFYVRTFRVRRSDAGYWTPTEKKDLFGVQDDDNFFATWVKAHAENLHSIFGQGRQGSDIMGRWAPIDGKPHFTVDTHKYSQRWLDQQAVPGLYAPE